MAHVANFGRDAIIEFLASVGATDIQRAFDRACLQGQLETARLLHSMGAELDRGIVMRACETLSDEGLGFLLGLGAELTNEKANCLAPIAMVPETYSRNPTGKHKCLALMEKHGIDIFARRFSLPLKIRRFDDSVQQDRRRTCQFRWKAPHDFSRYKRGRSHLGVVIITA